MKTSIIIPSRGESKENLNRTLESIFMNATGDYEVIVGLNGKPHTHIAYDNVKVVALPENVGIKTMVNLLVATASGKYIYKSDAHCSFGKGFNEILQENMEDDWVVTPRFYVLDGKTWQWQDDRFYDYFYLCCPLTDPKGLRFKAGGHWPERTQERLVSHPTVDETPQFHGSGWFMTKDRFFELGGFPIDDPYGHGQEPLWFGLRNWLMGGKTMVNKKTWYAHLHQDSSQRGYPEVREETERTYRLTAEHFLLDRGHYVHNFEGFVDNHMPMPTWPENWRVLLDNWRAENGK